MLPWRLVLSISLLTALVVFEAVGALHLPEGVQHFSQVSDPASTVALPNTASDCAQDAPHHGEGEFHCANTGATIAAGPSFPVMMHKAGEKVVPLSDQIAESLFTDRLKRPPRLG